MREQQPTADAANPVNQGKLHTPAVCRAGVDDQVGGVDQRGVERQADDPPRQEVPNQKPIMLSFVLPLLSRAYRITGPLRANTMIQSMAVMIAGSAWPKSVDEDFLVHRDAQPRFVRCADTAVFRLEFVVENRLHLCVRQRVPARQRKVFDHQDDRFGECEMDVRRPVGVWDHGDACSHREGANAPSLRQATATTQIRLNDVHRLLFNNLLVAESGVFVLAAGDRDIRLLPQLGIAVEVVGEECLLDPRAGKAQGA